MLKSKVLLYKITEYLVVMFTVLELKSYNHVMLSPKLVLCIRKIFVALATDAITGTF
jgi:hypothetical protein